MLLEELQFLEDLLDYILRTRDKRKEKKEENKNFVVKKSPENNLDCL